MFNNILQYLEQTVPQVPDKLAFSTGTEGLTFSALYAHARTIGAGLLARGYVREPIAVLMDKHPHTIATFFGVLYAVILILGIGLSLVFARSVLEYLDSDNNEH